MIPGVLFGPGAALKNIFSYLLSCLHCKVTYSGWKKVLHKRTVTGNSLQESPQNAFIPIPISNVGPVCCRILI